VTYEVERIWKETVEARMILSRLLKPMMLLTCSREVLVQNLVRIPSILNDIFDGFPKGV
jgi:hypothetical protein